jgi:hypothetical protein
MTDGDPHDPAHWAPRNQSLSREINEAVKELHDSFEGVAECEDWMCECANADCVERVRVSSNEYEAVRADGSRFFVAPTDEHVWAECESITERTDRYWIVEKIDAAAYSFLPRRR